MKSILFIFFVFTFSSVFAVDMVKDTVQCQKYFGNPIFDFLLVEFKVEKDGPAERMANVTVNYHHSGIDSNYYTKPFIAKVKVIDLVNKGFDIRFDDITYGENDYSGGIIKFGSIHDDMMGDIVSLQYHSDGASYFGLLKCDHMPKFSY